MRASDGVTQIDVIRNDGERFHRGRPLPPWNVWRDRQSVRARRAFIHLSIDSYESLEAMTEQDLLGKKGFGTVTLQRLKEEMKSIGLPELKHE